MAQCPICSKDMDQVVRDGATIDVCYGDGLWLDRSELHRITESERHKQGGWQWADLFRQEKRPPVDKTRTLACIRCGEPMRVESHLGVHIDWCREHGVWLDQGELEAILNNLRLDPLYVGRVALRLYDERF